MIPKTTTMGVTRRRLWSAWTTACALGEAIGIGLAAATAILIGLAMGEPVTATQRAVVLVLMVVAGALEGLALGLFQWSVLGEAFPKMSARSWALATAAVAALGWLLGMLPSTLSAPSVVPVEPPNRDVRVVFALFLAPVFGLVAGSIVGAAQWLVLRRHAHRAGSWISANALGWAVAFPWIYVAGTMPAEDTPVSFTFVLAVVAGALGGLSLGAVTGAFLLRLTPIEVEGGVMLCRELMKRDVARCMETLTVEACARMMKDNNIGFLPVVDTDKRVVGVITDRDLAVRVLAEGLQAETPVGNVMTRDVRICHPDDKLQEAEWKMSTTRKSRLVVADDDGHCVGVISLSDIAQADSRSRAGGVLRAVTRREAPMQIALP
jgi:CBS domain-containing protein